MAAHIVKTLVTVTVTASLLTQKHDMTSAKNPGWSPQMCKRIVAVNGMLYE